MHTGTGRIARLSMNTMSLYESGDSSGKESLKDFCNDKLTAELLDEVSLEKLALYIVRGGWFGNINDSSENVHLMPRSYIANIMNEDINELDDDTEYNRHKVELLLTSLARNESTTVSNLSIFKDNSSQDNESISRNTIDKYLDALNRLFLFNNQKPFSPIFRSS